MTRSASLLSPTTPRRVWSQLTAECRHRAIWCVAQLAMNQIAANPDRIPPEVIHEHPDRTPQITRYPSPAPGVDLYSAIYAELSPRAHR